MQRPESGVQNCRHRQGQPHMTRISEGRGHDRENGDCTALSPTQALRGTVPIWRPPGLPLHSRVIVSQTRSRVPRRNVHCNSHRSSHRIRHRNGHRALSWTSTCISTWILNRISTLTSTCVRRCTTSCYRTRSAHRFRSCSASSSSRRPARSGLFSTSTSTLTWPCPNHGGGIGGVGKGTGARVLVLGKL